MKTKLLGVLSLALFALGMFCSGGQATTVNVGDPVSGSIYIDATTPPEAQYACCTFYYGNLGTVSANIGGETVSRSLYNINSFTGYLWQAYSSNNPLVHMTDFELALQNTATTSSILPLEVTSATIASFTYIYMFFVLPDSPTTGTYYRIALSSLVQVDSSADFTFSGTFSDVSEIVTGTPLPAALPLFATGLGVLGLLGWRRKRKTSAAIAA